MSESLEKSFSTKLDSDLGTINIRVVVLQKSTAAEENADSQIPIDADAEEVLPDSDKRPINTYLETPKRGKFCCVFLVNGQRQHAWDNTFIIRDLGFKYLRNRTLIVVDVDGLKPEALAHLMQGSRNGFYEGEVYEALSSRVIATLKADPNMVAMEEQAEEEVSSLKAGDETVKAALDQLIDEHHPSGDHGAHGHEKKGNESRNEVAEGQLNLTSDIVTQAHTSVGAPAVGPVLVMKPELSTIRLKPGEAKQIRFVLDPATAGVGISSFSSIVNPPVTELMIKDTVSDSIVDVAMTFQVPDDFDEDEYPIETNLRAVAQVKGFEERRVSEHKIVINKAKEPTDKPVKPKPAPVLLPNPTYIRVTSRKPINMLVDGPDVHVRIKWDGQDTLLKGDPAQWMILASCNTDPTIAVSISMAENGRFELLIQTPKGLTHGAKLLCQVEAKGPAGQSLATSFEIDVVAPPEARKLKTQIQAGAERRAPYDLHYIEKENWKTSDTCWGGEWSGEDAGSFQLPTETKPLTIFINADLTIYAEFRESLKDRKLAEATIKERTTRYVSHLAFHLWQMAKSEQKAMKDVNREDGEVSKIEEFMRAEIKRMAVTLVKMMQISK